MIQGQLKNNKGEVLATFDAPQSLYELPLNRYVDFITEMDKRNEDSSNEIACISRAVSAFFGIDLESVMMAQYSEGEQADAVTAHLMAVKQLYGYAANLIDRHLGEMMATPKINMESQSFDFCGQQFVLPAIGVRALSNGDIEKILPPLTTVECIEAAEVHRLTDALITENGDPDGNYIYAKYLKVLSVFSRLSGESMPLDDRAREQFIVGRADFFGGNNPNKEIVNAGISLDVDFFLTPFSVRYGKAPIVVGFLYLRSRELALTALLKPKPTRGQKPKAKRTAKKSLKGLGGESWSKNYLRKATLKRQREAEQN